MYWVRLFSLFQYFKNGILDDEYKVNLIYYICIDAAKDEYFQRNFAWHAITQYSGDLTCNCKNATIIFLRPVPDQLAKDRLGLMVSQ